MDGPVNGRRDGCDVDMIPMGEIGEGGNKGREKSEKEQSAVLSGLAVKFDLLVASSCLQDL